MKKTFFSIFFSAFMLITFSCSKIAQDEQPTPQKTETSVVEAISQRANPKYNNLVNDIANDPLFLEYLIAQSEIAIRANNHLLTLTTEERRELSVFMDNSPRITLQDFKNMLSNWNCDYDEFIISSKKVSASYKKIIGKYQDLANITIVEQQEILNDASIIVENNNSIPQASKFWCKIRCMVYSAMQGVECMSMADATFDGCNEIAWHIYQSLIQYC